MGVHDYGSILFNREGEQNLVTCPDRGEQEESLLDDVPLALEVWDDEGDDEVEKKVAELLETDPDLLEETIATFLTEQGVGENKAYLLLRGEDDYGQLLLYWLPVEYDWDGWDFYLDLEGQEKTSDKGTEGTEDATETSDQGDRSDPDRSDGDTSSGPFYLGYREATDHEMTPDWEMSEETVQRLAAHIPELDAFRGAVKVTNFTPRAYGIVTDPNTLAKMYNEELIHAAGIADIPLEKIADLNRREVFDLLCEFLRNEVELGPGDNPVLLSVPGIDKEE